MSSDKTQSSFEWHAGEHVPVAELAQRQGVGPVKSVADLVRPGAFDPDEELDEFTADLYASRHVGPV